MFIAKLFKSYHLKPNFNHKISFLLQISLFVLKYSSLEPTFSLYDALIHLHIYCFKPHFPSYTFIWPYMIISFLQIFLPTRLFRPTLILGTLEYHGFWGKQKTVIDKIRDKQGLLLKPSNGGKLFTKSPYFGYFAF